MHQRIHTLNEYSEDFNLKLFNIDKQQKDNKFDIEDVGDFLHIGLLINHQKGNNVFMNAAACNILNYSIDEIEALGTNYINSSLFDDNEIKSIRDRVEKLYKRNDASEILSFFQRIRPQGKDDYEWMFITSKLFSRQENEPPQERLLIACPVSMMGDMSVKINSVLDENEFMRKYFRKFALLTKREKEILTLVAGGNKNPFISERLFISRHTVEQHRKNIRAKLGFKNIAETIRFARAFDLI